MVLIWIGSFLRIVSWTVFGERIGSRSYLKPNRAQSERSDKGIQETHGIFSRDIIVERFREEQRLGAIQAGAMIHA